MSAKTPIALVRLVVPAGAAKPSPPVGPALGQHGVNIMSFCKDFNAKTSEHKSDVPVPVEIAIYGDKSFEWRMKTPPASYFIAKAAGVAKSSTRPGHAFVGSINLKHAYEIAKVKASDETMGHVGLESATKSVLGTARAMGIRVVDPRATNVN
ncbi:Putative mitochondrial ribosomal protein L11 [Ostreococcus lucimarinus CCE9901]|jgi:large subunit ribosomal protein L11|uniref:Large ribosomal subunit protein uL11m n=1 Tax=Ostreococcus lucimarinus (strain CCE9901) TaxID=436017 RepID=A4RSA9_OSTLU|nr:Putative mitochondrial ribosomal protein L11 [Ostreococcus lucimarinus CCE9901]ABO94814.1 Putative mitochondrial ribosomal protein L11 [Ostreococcus lucimarinus CCE9901]|tara:strand:+ start:5619 stop:6077 length:459 start_codon:yes stop_codon:yes gene_type:complete|mmetsp:Transcript_6787/g.27254  ORF Transcript_6787/g.27254 Transcript_6787/m.27254 type:complete len:153 (+) Transcript_6787:96-554(+)|eukprot:XP_001416521.1 Putative mitochondrial ribosomal protein L11 [Ostreococcus lucimarinus CCE9901]